MTRISGPLGIWPFPVLNFLRDLVEGIRSRPSVLSSQPVVRNVEEIVWTDWKGRERKMTIHREVE